MARKRAQTAVRVSLPPPPLPKRKHADVFSDQERMRKRRRSVKKKYFLNGQKRRVQMNDVDDNEEQEKQEKSSVKKQPVRTIPFGGDPEVEQMELVYCARMFPPVWDHKAARAFLHYIVCAGVNYKTLKTKKARDFIDSRRQSMESMLQLLSFCCLFDRHNAFPCNGNDLAPHLAQGIISFGCEEENVLKLALAAIGKVDFANKADRDALLVFLDSFPDTMRAKISSSEIVQQGVKKLNVDDRLVQAVGKAK